MGNYSKLTVRTVGEHAYVSLNDCMVDLLGHGIPIGLIEDDSTSQMVRTISESIRAKSIARRGQIMAGLGGDSSLCLYVVEWSDAFEPSSSVKSNRGSVWLKTVTISPPHDKLHSMTNAYPIAVGPHDVDHEEVEKLFAEELKKFRSGKDVLFYHGKFKKNVKVYLELLCSLQDQPKRRSCNYTGEENSPFYTFFTHFVAVLGVQSWDNVGASHCTLGSLVIPHKLGLFTPICD